MNKRLDEIEKQSYTEVMHERGGTYMAFDKEKFAELIVKECAEFANEHNSEVEGVTLGIGRALKQHFGVEE